MSSQVPKRGLTSMCSALAAAVKASVELLLALGGVGRAERGGELADQDVAADDVVDLVRGDAALLEHTSAASCSSPPDCWHAALPRVLDLLAADRRPRRRRRPLSRIRSKIRSYSLARLSCPAVLDELGGLRRSAAARRARPSPGPGRWTPRSVPRRRRRRRLGGPRCRRRRGAGAAASSAAETASAVRRRRCKGASRA